MRFFGIRFSELVAFGAICRIWRSNHGKSAASNELAQDRPAGECRHQAPRDGKSGGDKGRWDHGTCGQIRAKGSSPGTSAGRAAGLPSGDRELAEQRGPVHRFRCWGACFSPVGDLPGALRGGFRAVSAPDGEAGDAVDAGAGARRGPGRVGGRAGRWASHLHPERANAGISAFAAHGSFEPGISAVSAAADATVGRTCPGGFPGLRRQLPEPDAEDTAQRGSSGGVGGSIA